MLDWNQYEFFGILPRLRGKQLPRGYATVAHNVDLTHGTLLPFREPLKVKELNNAIRMYVCGCDIYAFDKCVEVAEWLPDCPRLFVTGGVGYPETVELDGENMTFRRLGVIQPTTPPDVQPIYINTEKSRSVAYVVTFVSYFGEESAPSLPSIDISIEDGTAVGISLNYNPPLEYDIKSMRIYRRETGFRTGAEKEQEMVTNWFLVGEVSGTNAFITDTVTIAEVGYGLTTQEVREPPKNMRNITNIEETAILAGSVANKLYFSQNLQSYNFPLSQEMTLDDSIVAMQSVGNTLYVATDGYPYQVVGDAGCDSRECRQVNKYDIPMPMIACHTGKGSTKTPFGMVYVSADGLVLLSGNTQRVITSDVFSADDWRRLAPHTMRLAFHKGAIYCVSEVISFILWLDSDTYQDSKHKRLVTIEDEPIDMVETRQGELLLLLEDGAYQWNAGSTWRPYKWVSGDIDSPFLYCITRIRLKVNEFGVRCNLQSSVGEVIRDFPVGDNILPFSRLGRHKVYNIEITGIGEVTEIDVGVSQLDMASK